MNDVVGLRQWPRELAGVASSVRSRTVVGHLHPRFVVPGELRGYDSGPARFHVRPYFIRQSNRGELTGKAWYALAIVDEREWADRWPCARTVL
jgi:hypothetical protein